jgi:drug/metabolite transporter (DMT)-like permease
MPTFTGSLIDDALWDSRALRTPRLVATGKTMPFLTDGGSNALLVPGTMQPAPTSYLEGAACGLAAVLIWASWSAVTRLAVTTQLDAWDVAALRFGIAGALLLPVVLRRGLARDRLGWLGLAVIIAGGGAPYVLVTAEGLRFAPAHDQGVLNPGFMPIFVALIAAITLNEKLTPIRSLGLGLILTGALVIVGWHAMAWSSGRTLGHGLFLLASFMWACFTVVLRRSGLDPIHAVALLSTGSLVIYLPIYVGLHGTRLAHPPLADMATQAVFQGVLVTIVSLLLYGRAIAILGASGGAAFGALVPALSALFAIPLLAEWPTGSDWVGIVLVSVGVYLASGGPLPSRPGRGAARVRPPGSRSLDTPDERV